MIITIYSDAGHAWAKVKKQFLVKLGIDKDISQYSYQRGDYAYLEEDCDLTKLCISLEANGIPFAFNEKVAYERPSKIRSYQSYKKVEDMTLPQCPKCRGQLSMDNVSDGYMYQCPKCDEDFYSVEV